VEAPAPHHHFVLQGGGQGEVVAYSALHTIVHSPRAFPPGATLRASIPGIACPFEVKVRSCKRISTEPLTFTIDGRLQNGTREMLDRLSKLPAPG